MQVLNDRIFILKWTIPLFKINKCCHLAYVVNVNFSLCYPCGKLHQSNDSGQVTQGLLNRELKEETWVCVIGYTVKWNSNSTERDTALHDPSDHLSSEPGKDNHVPRAKPTAFPQAIQWLACISYRRLFSSLNNWQRKSSGRLHRFLVLELVKNDRWWKKRARIPQLWQRV